MSWLYLILALAAVAGVPLFAVMGGVAVLSFYLVGVQPSAVIIELMRLATTPSLVSIPLFTFAGYLLAESKAPQRLILFYRAWFGWLPAGLPVASLIACSFFTAFTGASGVTIIALGGLLLPILTGQKYSEKFALGLVTTSGSLGLLFAPSLPLILYGVISGTNINQLFLGGLLPGFLLILLLSLYSAWVARKNPPPRQPFQLTVALLTLKKSLGELIIPPMLLILIYGGFVTVGEMSALTVFYVLMLELFVYKDVSMKRDLPRIASESMVLVGGIFIILGCALGFTNYVVDAQVPMKLLAWMQQYITSQFTFLLVLNLVLLVVGSLLDIFSAIIMVPLILPLAQAFDIHPVHLGIVFLANMEVGYLFPPVGLNLFISSFRFRKPLTEIYAASWPFLLVLLVGLLVITYVPFLTLAFLP